LENLAHQGYPPAQKLLADYYHYGNGREQDKDQRNFWMLKAAEANYTPAQYSLACFFESSDGMPYDYEQMMHWFLKAAEQVSTRVRVRAHL
jgi:uncharacterized protein